MIVQLTKTQLMQRVIEGREHESFEHETEGRFDITLMRQAIANRSIPFDRVLVAIDQIAPFARENRVFDEARIRELPESSWRHDPPIYIEMEDGLMLLVDGTHRILRAEQERMKVLTVDIVPFSHAIRPAPGWVPNNTVDWGRPL